MNRIKQFTTLFLLLFSVAIFTGCPSRQVKKQKKIVKKPVVPVKTADDYLTECEEKIEKDTDASVAEAVRLCKKALSMKSDLPKAHLNLGYAYEHKKDWKSAVQAFKEYLKSKPLKAQKFKLRVAKLHIKAGETKKAIAIYEAFRKLDDTNLDLLNNLAALYTKSGRYKDAEATVQAILAQDSKNIQAYRNLVLAYYSAGQLNQAEVAARNALKNINSKDAQVANNLGMVYIKKKQYDKARAMFTQTLVFNKNNVQAKLNLGTIAIREGAWKIAVRWLADVLRSKPKHVYALRNYGVALLGMRKTKEAKKIYERLLALDSNDPEALFQLGVIYFTDKSLRKEQKRSESFFSRYLAQPTSKKLVSYKRTVAFIKQARKRLKMLSGGGRAPKAIKKPKKKPTPKPQPTPEPKKEPAKTPEPAKKDAPKKAEPAAKKETPKAAPAKKAEPAKTPAKKETPKKK